MRIEARMPGFVAYYRVSTDRQGESELGLEAQRAAVARFTHGASLLSEFQEIESGKRHTNDRCSPLLSTYARHRLSCTPFPVPDGRPRSLRVSLALDCGKLFPLPHPTCKDLPLQLPDVPSILLLRAVTLLLTRCLRN